MTPEDLLKESLEALARGDDSITLVVDKLPRPFPRGELLCENSWHERVYRFKAQKIIAWYHKYLGQTAK